MRTLLSVSHTPLALPTAKFAELLTLALQSEVALLTVRPHAEAPQVGERVLARAAELLSVPPATRLVRHGLPEDEILAEMESGQFDLLMIGARDHPTMTGKLLLGCVARRVVKHAGASVLVIRQPTGRLEHLLVCTAGPETAEPTVLAGARLAQATGARITLLHVAAAVPSMYAGLSRLGESLPELLQSDTPIARHIRECASLLKRLNVEAQIELRHGVPAEEILRAAELTDFDLLVIGASRQGRLNRLLLDDVSLQIVTHAPRPVLVVRGDLEGRSQ